MCVTLRILNRHADGAPVLFAEATSFAKEAGFEEFDGTKALCHLHGFVCGDLIDLKNLKDGFTDKRLPRTGFSGGVFTCKQKLPIKCKVSV